MKTLEQLGLDVSWKIVKRHVSFRKRFITINLIMIIIQSF